jgi:hypothetical protein
MRITPRTLRAGRTTALDRSVITFKYIGEV